VVEGVVIHSTGELTLSVAPTRLVGPWAGTQVFKGGGKLALVAVDLLTWQAKQVE
jgi:hypothetical protein